MEVGEKVWFKRIEVKLKSSLYLIADELLKVQDCTMLIYKMILFVEALQLTYFSVHPTTNNFMWKSSLYSIFQSCIQYFQPNPLLYKGGDSMYLLFLYGLLSITLFISLIFNVIANSLLNSQKTQSSFLNYGIKIISIFGLVFNKLLFLPYCNLVLVTFYNTKDSPYYNGLTMFQGVYYLHFVVAILCLLFTFFCSLLYSFLFNENNPNSFLPFASQEQSISFYKQLQKLLFVGYFTFDYNATYIGSFVFFICFYNLCILTGRYYSPVIYNRSIQEFQIVLESFTLWSSFCVLITSLGQQSGSNGTGFYFFGITSIFFCIMIMHMFYLKEKSLYLMSISTFQTDDQVALYTSVIFHLIQTRDETSQRLILEGIVNVHMRKCKASDCYCINLVSDYSRAQDTPNAKMQWFSFLQHILQQGIEKFPRSCKLYILNAQIYHETLKNPFKALAELSQTKKLKPTIQEQFVAYRYMKIIEEEMQEQDLRKIENRGIDILNIIQTQKHMEQFQTLIDESSMLHLEFWKEFLEESPNIQKVQSLGSQINQAIARVQLHYKKIFQSTSSQIKSHELYGFYLKNIINDEVESARLIERSFNYRKNASSNKYLNENSRLKYSENSDCTVFTISCERDALGIITNCNDQVQDLLGFHKGEIMGQPVTRIMPKCYEEIHNLLLVRFLDSSVERIIGREKIVFAQDKQGYLLQCTLMIRMIPMLTDGLHSVGFLSKLEQKSSRFKENNLMERIHFLIYKNDESYQLFGLTRSLFTKFGLRSQFVYGVPKENVEFSFELVCPEIAQEEVKMEMQSSSGSIVCLDTTVVPAHYLEQPDEDRQVTDPKDQPSQFVKKQKALFTKSTTCLDADFRIYKKMRVKLNIIEEFNQEGQNFLIIKIVELDTFDESKRIKQSTVQQNLGSKRDNGSSRSKEIEGSFIQNEEEFNQSHLSNASVGDELNQIKDFKLLISEKTVPRSVKILSRIVFFLFLSVACVASLKIYKQEALFVSTHDGVIAISSAYERQSLIADIFHIINILSSFSNGQFSPDLLLRYSFEESLLNLKLYQDQLENNQFQIIKSILLLEEPYLSSENTILSMVFKKIDGTLVEFTEMVLTECIYEYISLSKNLLNTTLKDFSNLVEQYDISRNIIFNYHQQSIYFLRKNGIFNLRNQTLVVAQDFYNYYQNINEQKMVYQLIFAGIAICLLFFPQFYLVSSIQKVHNINNKVISLFGYIPMEDLQELVKKCEFFIFKYTEESEKKSLKYSQALSSKQMKPNINIKKNHNYLEMNNEDLDNSDVLDKNLEKHNSVEDHIVVDPNNVIENPGQQFLLPIIEIKNRSLSEQDHSPKSNLSQDLGGLSPSQSKQIEMSNLKKDPKDQKDVSKITEPKLNEDDLKKQQKEQLEQKKAEEEKSEELAIRLEKLNNPKNENYSKILIQFGILVGVYMAYFCAEIYFSLVFFKDVKLLLTHLQLISIRPNTIKYSQIFTLEDIISTEQIYDLYRVQYIQFLYENEGDITSSIQSSFPSQFDSYFQTFRNINLGDLCTSLNPLNATDPLYSRCVEVNSEILKKGLTQSLIGFAENCRASIQLIKEDKPKLGKVLYLNNENIYLFAIPLVDYLNKLFGTTFTTYMTSQSSLAELKFAILISSIIIVFLFLWLPYRTNLNHQIWKTKGMLNMIPLEYLTKNEKIKKALQQGIIIQAVK